jgi:hypothetical protein
MFAAAMLAPAAVPSVDVAAVADAPGGSGEATRHP